MGHEERDHALLSASGAHRWLLCTPSARLEEQFPDTASEAAEEGTLAYELAELKARNYFDPGDISKRKLNSQIKKMKEDKLWQDEMLTHTDTYTDYIRDVSLRMPSKPSHRVETRLNLEKYIPGGFGTADLILLQGENLHVIDFKYGKRGSGHGRRKSTDDAVCAGGLRGIPFPVSGSADTYVDCTATFGQHFGMELYPWGAAKVRRVCKGTCGLCDKRRGRVLPGRETVSVLQGKSKVQGKGARKCAAGIQSGHWKTAAPDYKCRSRKISCAGRGCGKVAV